MCSLLLGYQCFGGPFSGQTELGNPSCICLNIELTIQIQHHKVLPPFCTFHIHISLLIINVQFLNKSHKLYLQNTLHIHSFLYIFTCPKESKSISRSVCPTLSSPIDCSPPGKNTGVGIHSLLQGMFQTQGSKVGSLHCRQILFCLSHQKSPLHLQIIIFTVFL